MASHYYGLNIGEGVDPADVASSTSSNSKDVELVLLDGAGLDKIKVLNALEAIVNYFKRPNNTVTA